MWMKIIVGMNKTFSVKAVSCLEKNKMRLKKYSHLDINYYTVLH